MRIPRFRLRSLLVAVAVAAGLLAFAARPYPRKIRSAGAGTISTRPNPGWILGADAVASIEWSDGSVSEFVPEKGVSSIWMRVYGPAMRVDWGDGSISWYLLPWMPRWDRPGGKPPSNR